MAPTAQAHGRHRNLLLFQKLLNLRDGASPFTLVLDSLEQPAGPIIKEFAFRAKKVSKTKVIYLRFSTLKKAPHADVLVTARGKRLDAVRTELLSHCPPVDSAATKQKHSQRAVVILDSLNPLATSDPESLGTFLSSIISPVVSLVAIYHADVPLVPARNHNEYAPQPLTLLTHLATAILRLSSLRHEIDRQKARNRSLEEPEFGLREGREGVLIGLQHKPRSDVGSGLVAEMELRRRSGRSVTDTFVVSFPAGPHGEGRLANFCPLKMYSAFAPPEGPEPSGVGGGEEEEQPESTFNLGLTEKQRRDREGIVLPYFDAQIDIGAGEGGRILYDMGREDDFDDEEDEI